MEAINNGIIIFAAAGNEGTHFNIPFPAIMENVFCIGSARGKGSPSEFNPPHGTIEKYSALGEEVVGAYFCESPDGVIHDEKQARSGSSIAVPVAAGIAANMLAYLDQMILRPKGGDASMAMRKLFLAMSGATRNENYRNLVPWDLFKHNGRENRERIKQILEEEPGIFVKDFN
jgi:hypothetical protein